MVLGWFDASEAKQFGVSLARLFIERTKLDAANMKTKLIVKKEEEFLNKISEQVARFKRQHRMNMYKKAQLGNAFKWTLRDAGYDPKDADNLTTWLLLRC